MRPGQRQIKSARPVRFTESEFLRLEALYITEDFKLMKVEPLGPDTLVQDLYDYFDPATMDAEKYHHEVLHQQAIYEARRREYGILYYKPYNALAVEHHWDALGRHTANRIILPGKNPDPKIAPINQPDCYQWTEKYPQEDFHKSKKRIRLQLASNKVGKTYGASADCIKISFGIHPVHKLRTPNKGRIIGTDLEKGIEEDVWGIYKTLFPMSELSSEPRKYSGGQIKKLNCKNGSSVEYMSYEQDAGLFEGGEGDWVFFNEPPPRAIYVACMRWLMKRNGIMFIAATPLWEAWLYDELFLKQGPGEDQPDVFQLCAYENPYLSCDGIKSLVDATPEDEIEARIFGGFKHLTGLVYGEFGDIHRIPTFKIPKDWTRVMAMDYHARTPCAVLWAAIDPHEQVFFYDELKIDKTIGEIAEVIKAKEKAEYGRPVPTRWIDSIAATPDRSGTKITSALKEFRTVGENINWPLAFRASTKNRAAGINAVRDYLKIKKGKPGCYFLEQSVPETIASKLHYQWSDNADDTTTKNETKTVDNKWAHFPDAERYILVTRPSFRRAQVGQESAEEKDPYSVTD